MASQGWRYASPLFLPPSVHTHAASSLKVAVCVCVCVCFRCHNDAPVTVTILDCTAVQRKQNDPDSIVRFYNCEVAWGDAKWRVSRRWVLSLSVSLSLSLPLPLPLPLPLSLSQASLRGGRYNMFHQLHEDLRMEFSTAHCLCVSLPPSRSLSLSLSLSLSACAYAAAQPPSSRDRRRGARVLIGSQRLRRSPPLPPKSMPIESMSRFVLSDTEDVELSEDEFLRCACVSPLSHAPHILTDGPSWRTARGCAVCKPTSISCSRSRVCLGASASPRSSSRTLGR